MACAVLSDGNAGVGRTYFYIYMRVSYRVSYLFKGSACGEHRKRACKNRVTRRSHACRNAHHIALCYAAVDKAVGESLFEHTGFGCRREVGIEHNKLFVLLAKLYERLAVGISCCRFNNICHFAVLLILRQAQRLPRQAPPWPRHTAPYWERCRASLPCSP